MPDDATKLLREHDEKLDRSLWDAVFKVKNPFIYDMAKGRAELCEALKK